MCPLCNIQAKSLSYLFVECQIANRTWNVISRWLNIDLPSQLGPSDLVTWMNSLQVSRIKKYVTNVIIRISCFAMWKYRNNVVFSESMRKTNFIFDFIVDMSFMWFSNKHRKNFILWVYWLQNPLNFL